MVNSSVLPKAAPWRRRFRSTVVIELPEVTWTPLDLRIWRTLRWVVQVPLALWRRIGWAGLIRLVISIADIVGYSYIAHGVVPILRSLHWQVPALMLPVLSGESLVLLRAAATLPFWAFIMIALPRILLGDPFDYVIARRNADIMRENREHKGRIWQRIVRWTRKHPRLHAWCLRRLDDIRTAATWLAGLRPAVWVYYELGISKVVRLVVKIAVFCFQQSRKLTAWVKTLRGAPLIVALFFLKLSPWGLVPAAIVAGATRANRFWTAVVIVMAAGIKLTVLYYCATSL